MNELFLKIINISISASWLILAVLALRPILKKTSKWVSVLLWGIVAVRLLNPFTIESTFSLIPSAETIPGKVLTGPGFEIQTGIAPVDNRVNDYLGDRYFEGVTVPADNGFHVLMILTIVWIIGILILAVYTAVSYWHLHQKIATGVLYRNNIFQSENVSFPFVLGIVRPRIYLPFKMDEQDLQYVIAHEQAHIHRKDHWWKPLGFLLLMIHWFNPLMWLAYVLLCRDIELACDEKVIKDLDNEQRADYTQVLVSCSVNRHMIAACPLAFGEVRVKERVKSIMNYKKPAFWITMLSVTAGVVIAVCFLTNPKQDRFDTGIVDPPDLEQYRTDYIGDAPKVSAIAQQLPYPAGYIYSSIELQTSAKPYELIVYLDGEGSVQKKDFESCALTAFNLIGNMGIISFRNVDSQSAIASFYRTYYEENIKFYLTIGEEGVTYIQISTANTSGGCQRADELPFRKGERVWLDNLEGFTDLRGVAITAFNEEGEVIWSVSIPDGEENRGFTYFAEDDWVISF